MQHSSAPNDAKPPIINYRFSKSFLNELSHSINKAYYIISKRSVNKNFKIFSNLLSGTTNSGNYWLGIRDSNPDVQDQNLLCWPITVIPIKYVLLNFTAKTFKLANGGSEWERSTASGFSVLCTTTNYTTDPLKQMAGLIAIETTTTSWSSGHAKSYGGAATGNRTQI